MAPVFPTSFSWMEKEMIRVTGRVTSTVVVGASCGAMLNPVILGFLMQELSPMWFCYLLFAQTVLLFLLFLFLLSVSRFYFKKHYIDTTKKVVELGIKLPLHSNQDILITNA